jgi:hypothetical protein
MNSASSAWPCLWDMVVLKAAPASTYIPCASSGMLACEPHGICALGLLVLCACCSSVVVVRLLAGGRPATTYLFCFAKKGMPKKATQSRCPCGIPNCAGRKMGNEANSLRSDSFTSDPFSAPHNWQRHMRIRVKSQIKSRFNSQFKSRFKTQVKS